MIKNQDYMNRASKYEKRSGTTDRDGDDVNASPIWGLPPALAPDSRDRSDRSTTRGMVKGGRRRNGREQVRIAGTD
jgi:hypothetical protein